RRAGRRGGPRPAADRRGRDGGGRHGRCGDPPACRRLTSSAMPERTVALLRGINLGKRRVTNARLAELFELAGCRGVSTFRAAGNVLFDAGPGVGRIRAALEEGLGYEVAVYLRSATEMNRIATAPPFPDVEVAKPASLLVTFFD